VGVIGFLLAGTGAYLLFSRMVLRRRTRRHDESKPDGRNLPDLSTSPGARPQTNQRGHSTWKGSPLAWPAWQVPARREAPSFARRAPGPRRRHRPPGQPTTRPAGNSVGWFADSGFASSF
jgi:hypothetical protein